MIGSCYFSPLPSTQPTWVSSLCFLDSFRPQIVDYSTSVLIDYLYTEWVHIFFISPSGRGSKVSFIHKQSTGQTKQRNLERLTWDLPALGQASGSCLPANVNCQKIHVIMSVIGNKENSVWRLSLNVFLIGSNVLLKITFLKIGFILVQRENENSVSIVNEKRLIGAVKLKEGHQLTYRLLQTMVEWPFIKLRFWKLLVSTNCDIHYVIKILPNIRYNGLNYAYNIEI